MASAVISLSTGRKFNFSKYIFDSLVRNVNSSTKFYMYPRFLQLMIRAQVSDLSSHTTKYSSHALTQKVFANMRRIGKGFSGVETPLFEGMIVAQQADEGVAGVDVADKVPAGVDVDDVPAATDEPSIPSPTPTTPPPSQELPSTSQVIPTPPPSPISEPSPPPQQPQPSQTTHDTEFSMDLLQTLLETCTTLTRKVEVLEQDKVAQALEIIKRIIELIDADKDVSLENVESENDADVLSMQDDELEPAELKEVVKVVTTAKLMTEVVTTAAATITAATTLINVAPSATRRRKRVVIRDPEETATPSIIIHSEPKSKDKGKGIMVQEPKPLKKKTHIEKPQIEAQARKNMMIYLRNMVGFKIDYFKGMSYDDIHPIFEKYSNSNVAFLENTKEQLEEEDNRALKRTSESLEERAAKKQKLDEEVLVVDYAIHTVNNKPYFKIIRADGTYQLFLSFLSLLKNFDREDLEVLWQLVKERFASLKPKNFSDDFLLTTLTYMFEKPDVQAQVWKNQRSVHGLTKVKAEVCKATTARRIQTRVVFGYILHQNQDQEKDQVG
nr:hypothetical protein [Tanacetum cinerariifolium]